MNPLDERDAYRGALEAIVVVSHHTDYPDTAEHWLEGRRAPGCPGCIVLETFEAVDSADKAGTE